MKVLVTGSSRGVGRAVVQGLRGAGHEVIGVQRRIAPSSIEGLEFVEADLATPEGVAKVARACQGLAGIVLNAGIARAGSFDGEDDAIEVLLRINLQAPLQLLRALLRAESVVAGASVVFVSSNLARRGLAGQVAYSAAKGGLESAVRSLARELGPRGIRVNAVAPGLLRTDMSAGRPRAVFEEYAEQVPLGRVGEAVDVASVISFLLGDSAGYVTGQILDVDGGWAC